MSAPSRFLDRLPSIGGVVTLVLAIATVVVAGHNRGLQDTAEAGQKRLANAQAVGNLDNTLIRLLATAAVEHGDADIKALLEANGITYRQGTVAGRTGGGGAMSPFDRRLALLLTQLAFAVLMVNELIQLVGANAKLTAIIDRQSVDDAAIKRVSAQLDTLARGTQRLARNGNPQAAKIVDQLAQSGVHINATAAR